MSGIARGEHRTYEKAGGEMIALVKYVVTTVSAVTIATMAATCASHQTPTHRYAPKHDHTRKIKEKIIMVPTPVPVLIPVPVIIPASPSPTPPRHPAPGFYPFKEWPS